MKKELLEQLKALFEKNADVNKAYVTSDGNVFRAGHYAENWKQTLANKAVDEYTREAICGTSAGSTADTDSDTDGDSGSKVDTGDKDKLAAVIKKFIELFDTKPAAGLTAQEIEKQIADYEAEKLKNAGNDQPDPAKAERAALAKEFTELTGKQPIGLSVDKIKAKIAEAKAK
nr:hypothetical protein [Mucilaginibacter sp. L294]